MKTLKNLVKTDTLNIEELMLIKGASETRQLACDQNSCKNNACSSNACVEAACNHFACSSNSCSSGVCTKNGCLHAADSSIGGAVDTVENISSTNLY